MAETSFGVLKGMKGGDADGVFAGDLGRRGGG